MCEIRFREVREAEICKVRVEEFACARYLCVSVFSCVQCVGESNVIRTSSFRIGRSLVCVFFATRYNLIVRAKVIRGFNELNRTSISFFGFKERCQYCARPTGFGRTTPAVYLCCCVSECVCVHKKTREGYTYAACQISRRLIRLVTSLINNGKILLKLVYTQEIDLCHVNRTSSYSHISWNS